MVHLPFPEGPDFYCFLQIYAPDFLSFVNFEVETYNKKNKGGGVLMKICGAVTALVTPFTKNGGIHYDKLTELIEFQIANGADGIVLLGTTGEAPTITEEETEQVIRTGVEAAAGRIPVIVGCGCNDTLRAVEKCKRAQAFGADALLVLTPYYNKANPDGMAAHFLTIAEAVQTPVILYNVPSRTGCSISMGTLERLREHPQIIGIKEASGNITYMTDAASLLRDDFVMWSGNDDMTVAAMALGACGVISVAANILPYAMHEMTEKCLKGDFPSARTLQLRYLPLMRALFSDVNPIPIKEAMNYLGFDVGGYRLPLCGMNESLKNRLIMEIEQLEDIVWKKGIS